MPATTTNETQRLESWKEIAAHVGRDQRTVMRWAKLGMPVHREPGAKRGRIFAYAHEIEAWLASGGTAQPTPAAPLTADAPSLPPGWFPRIPRLVQAGLIAALAIGLFAVASFLWKATTAGPLASIALRDNKFVAVDKGGRALWTYPLPEGSPALPAGRTPGITYIGDLDGDGRNEVLISAPYAGPLSASEKVYERQLYCFSEAGKLLWRFDPRGTIAFGSGDYGPPWHILRWLLYRSGGETRIALAVIHHVWWPSALVILDAHGRELSRFVNSGHILSLTSIDMPSGPLLLAGGVSNANGPSGFLAVLDGKAFSGSSPEKVGSDFECKSCPPGHPLHYFVFPPSELNVRTLLSHNHVYAIMPAQSAIEVHTEEATSPEITSSGIFEFNPAFHLMKARWSDGYRQLHGELERQGKIKHTWEHCPDRFGPRLVRSWDPEHGWIKLHPNPAAK